MIALVALIGLQHHRPELPPIPTTDAVSNFLPASGELPIGAPAGPLHVPANTFQGAAIPATVRLVAETPDPHGGLPWGLRAFRTTRGQTCLQVGRVQHGTIGVIGQDGAWGNDHRFHPISPNAYTGQSCSPTDAAGHAINNVAVNGGGAIASANVPWGTGAQGGGCGANTGRRPQPACPPQDLRNLNYGLLGPDAVSIDFVGAGGRRYTEPTNAPDGAYLIVTHPARKAPPASTTAQAEAAAAAAAAGQQAQACNPESSHRWSTATDTPAPSPPPHRPASGTGGAHRSATPPITAPHDTGQRSAGDLCRRIGRAAGPPSLVEPNP